MQKDLAAAAPLAIDSSVRNSYGPKQHKLKLQLRVPAQDWYDGQLPGCVLVFLPMPDRPNKFVWSGGSVTRDCARQLLSAGLAVLMSTSKRVRGIRPVLREPEGMRRVLLRSASVGKPKLSGPTWTQGRLPNWAWHEVFYQVMNSCRTQPFPPLSWEEIVTASRPARRTKVIEMPKRPSWREILAKRIAA